jgi:hypothetical protein
MYPVYAPKNVASPDYCFFTVSIRSLPAHGSVIGILGGSNHHLQYSGFSYSPSLWRFYTTLLNAICYVAQFFCIIKIKSLLEACIPLGMG